MSSDEEEAYEVEKLLDRRRVAGVTQYLVKWVGYDSPEDNTWVDEDDCECPAMIKEFEKQRSSQRRSRSKSRSPSRRKPANLHIQFEDEADAEPVEKPKLTPGPKTPRQDKEVTVTANIETEPYLSIEVLPTDEDDTDTEEELVGIESSRVIKQDNKPWIWSIITIVVCGCTIAYWKIFRPEQSESAFYSLVEYFEKLFFN